MRQYILVLNDMRFAQIEMVREVARSDTPEQLMQLMSKERVEYYRDGQDRRWGKVYRKGGPLEWYNEPFENPIELIDTDEYRIALDNKLLQIPRVDTL